MRICSGSTPAASGVHTLTVVLTGATLSACWRVAGQVLAAMLAHDGFVVCVVCVPHNLMASSMHPSLSFTVFWFLLCLVHSSLATWPACWAAHATPAHGQSSSPFPRSSLMSFRRSTSFCHFWLLSFGCCGWVTPCWVCCGVVFFCVASPL